MTTAGRVASGLAVCLLLSALLILALLYRGLELGFAKTHIEKIASQRLGRALVLSQAPRIEFGKELSLNLRGLRIANPDWSTDDQLLHIRRADIQIETRSLLSGTMIISQLTLDGLQLALEVREDGKTNVPEMGSGDSPGDDTNNDDEGPRPSLLFRNILLGDVTVTRRNRRQSSFATFTIERLEQQANDAGIELTGKGRFQNYPWSLNLTGSPIRTLINGESINTQFVAQLADLNLRGELALPSLRELQDASLEARLAGSLPTEIADLSPLLDADTPIKINAVIDDIDPGVRVDINVDLTQLHLALTGAVDEPGTGDGLSLVLDANAASVPRLAAALELGETEELALTASGQLARNGDTISVTDLSIHIGEHTIQGETHFPQFPSTNSARLALNAKGPDFAFYQRLFKRPVGLPYPYTLQATLVEEQGTKERVKGRLDIGQTTLALDGYLGAFPSYRDSDLRLSLSGPSLKALGDSMDLELPDSPYTADGQISVSKMGKVEIAELRGESLGSSLRLTGSLNGHPDFDALDISITGHVDSLGSTSKLFGVRPLGDVPLALALRARGSIFEPELSDLDLRSNGLLATTQGSLWIADGHVNSDLTIDGEVENLPMLLGADNRSRLPNGRFKFQLAPTIDSELVTLSLRQLIGPGVQGQAELTVPKSLTADKRMNLSMRLEFRSIAEVFPDTDVFTPADRPLSLTAKTEADGAEKHISVQLSSEKTPLLLAQLQVPEQSDNAVVFQINGDGSDLQMLGRFNFAPQKPLPYLVDLYGEWQDKNLRIRAERLELAGTEINGNASWNGVTSEASADLEIPRGELSHWLIRDEDSDAPETADREKSDRLIPDTPIPLAWLSSFASDIRLQTGPLGLDDPSFPGHSLVDALTLSLRSGQGEARLEIDEMRGSRGVLQGTLALAAITEGNAAQAKLNMRVEDFPLGAVSRGRALNDLPLHDVDIELSASGTNLRDLAATTNGSLLMQGGAGTLQDMSLSFATESFLKQLLSSVLPSMEQTSDMQVECSVLALHAEDGVLSLDPGFVLRTHRVDLSARGEIDLKDESLAIRFDNQARKGLGISAASLVNPYVQITGTLAKPTLGLDVTSSALSGGAAIATGGLTVLAKPLFGRFMSRRNPCKAALDRWNSA